MSKYTASKVSAILVGASILAATVYPAFAQSLTADRQDATTAATNRKLVTPQKINIRQDDVDPKLEALRLKQASREAALKNKLQAFKDKNKAVIAERVNANLNKINQNQTNQMHRHLNTMSIILDKLQVRINNEASDIKDPAAAKSAIESAKANIATISAAVTTQAQKDYTIQVTSESKVRADIKSQRDKLHADLQGIRKLVIDAKKSVADAIRVTKSGPVIKPSATSSGLKKEGTSSGQQ